MTLRHKGLATGLTYQNCHRTTTEKNSVCV